MIMWFSMTKPTVAVAVAQQWERGALEIDDPVAQHVPEFAVHDKEGITLRHLLTHTAGIRGADPVTSTGGLDTYWNEVVAGICAVEREDDWEPGRRAGYHLGCGMTMLAEIVRRVDGRPFEHYVREEVFLPLGWTTAGWACPPMRRIAYGDRIGTMHSTQGDAPVPARPRSTTPDSLARCIPGGGGRGPMRQLGRLYEALLGRGELDGVASSRRRRWRRSPRATVSASTTRRSIASATGASASRSTISRWAVTRRRARSGTAVRSRRTRSPIPSTGSSSSSQTNGMCASDDHYLRLDDAMTALYLDLGIVPDDAKGRDKAIPAVQL